MSIALLVLALGCSTATPEAAPAPEPAPAAAPEPAEAPPPAEADAAVAVPTVNLNTASKEALSAIPDVTPKMVHEFEEYRPYISISQYRKEIGKYVKPDQIAAWEAHLFVPIAVNDSDARTMAQIPGLDVAGAEKLIAGRPYADNDAFLKALGEAISPAQLEAAATLLQ